MFSKVPLFVFILVSSQIVSSYGDAGVDDSAKKICETPALAGKGNERIHSTEFSKPRDAFLSKSVNSALAVCLGNNVAYRFEPEEPSKDDKVMQAARETIGETSPEAVEAAKAKLVDLLKKDTSLTVPLDNGEWLIRFLRLKNYDTQATYELIKRYYNFKIQNAKLVNSISPSKLTTIAESNAFMVSPKRDQNGRRIGLFTARNFDPKKYTCVDALKMTMVLSEVASYEPATQIAGFQCVFDMSGLTMNHVKRLTPALAKKIIDYTTSAAPFKYEKLHIVKQHRTFSALWAIMKPFMSKELRSKIFFHGNDMKSLQRHIDPSALPEIYGGSLPLPTFSSSEWNTLLKRFDDEYAKINTYGVKKN